MRLNLIIPVAALLVGGCTRDNPGFKADTGSADETGYISGDGDSADAADVATAEDSSSSDAGEESTGDGGDGDGDLPLPDCAEDQWGWITIPMAEDNYVYSAPLVENGCLLDPGDTNLGGSLPPVYGPPQVPCETLNFGSVPDFFLFTSGVGRTGYLGRLDLEEFTGRGIVVNQAHYKFSVPFSLIDGEVAMSLAPVRDDQAEWDAGEGLAEPVIEGESTMAYRNYPDAWDGENAFSVVDLTKLLDGLWMHGDESVEIEVPYGRVQGWLDEIGRDDPGFILWSDVVEPAAFYVGGDDSPAKPALWIEACLE